jgi:hypothetical protein
VCERERERAIKRLQEKELQVNSKPPSPSVNKRTMLSMTRLTDYRNSFKKEMELQVNLKPHLPSVNKRKMLFKTSLNHAGNCFKKAQGNSKKV